jgi:hypothetical protein
MQARVTGRTLPGQNQAIEWSHFFCVCGKRWREIGPEDWTVGPQAAINDLRAVPTPGSPRIGLRPWGGHRR